MNELANERHEQITKLQEQLEEAEERHAEATWRLGKAQHFERLVRHRKKLVQSLIQAIRAKQKANTALKAGLDGLRTHKAAAEVAQQKLLLRVETLASKLREAEDTIRQQQTTTEVAAETQSLAAPHEDASKIAELNQRLDTQAELIQSLEDELKAARAQKRDQENFVEIVEDLRGELERKAELILKLEADADELQRKLAKLRGSDSETTRLKAIMAQDHDLIGSLEQQISELKEALARRERSAATEQGSAKTGRQQELETKLKEKEDAIARLVAAVKEHESKTAALNEALQSWKRKYEFVTAEEPSAYKATAEK